MEKINQSPETVSSLKIQRFSDLRGRDLSGLNLTAISPEVLVTTKFDSLTQWPTADKMPAGFEPKRLLEEGKNPGLGIKSLHEKGIDGRGVNCAILDQRLDSSHYEYQASLKSCAHYGQVEEERISMHGPAVASLLVGKDCGVAPGANLHYKEIPARADGRTWENYAQALNDIVSHNDTCEENDKIRVVSCSLGYPNDKIFGDLQIWVSAIETAKKSGIFFIDSNTLMGYYGCTGGGSFGDREDFESYKSWLYHNDKKETDSDLKKLLDEGDVENIFKAVREKGDMRIKGMTDDDLRARIMEEIKINKGRSGEKIIIPSDYRTMASAYHEPDQYLYSGRGGISWSIPYLAGLSALILQIKPDITPAEFSDLIKQTAITNKAGLKIINPIGIVEALGNKF